MKTEKSIKPRLRLAPSPTGFLHLGNFRTALFTYLLARHWGGEVILRIEDTDAKREVAGATKNLISTLSKMGITFDEGPHLGGNYGPYIQSERLKLYQAYAKELVEKGCAYYCFATPEELEHMRQEQVAKHLPPRYDRRYRNLSVEEVQKRLDAGQPYVIRQAMPLEGEIIVHDELRGAITFQAKELEDHVLLKSDGGATYQLASVVDDHLMSITHVTRGDEWLPSLPKNILLYQAFGWKPPLFIHLPLILNKAGGKLSKRQGDVFVEDYINKGYLPEALINFSALLGWHPKNDTEIFSLTDLITMFDVDGIGVSPAIFDQEKLDYVNGIYIREKKINELLELAKPFFMPLLTNAPEHKKSNEFLTAVLNLEQPRLHYLGEISENVNFFFKEELSYEADLLIWKKLTKEDVKENLEEMLKLLESFAEKNWEKSQLETTIITHLKANNKALGDYLWPLRVAVSGRKASPGPFEIIDILGKEESMIKIKKAIALLG